MSAARRKEQVQVVEDVRSGSPFAEVEIVERPTSTKQQWMVDAEVKLIAQTVETGKAVKLAARAGAAMKNLQMALRHAVAKQGMTMHYRKGVGERIVAWAEKASEASK